VRLPRILLLVVATPAFAAAQQPPVRPDSARAADSAASVAKLGAVVVSAEPAVPSRLQGFEQRRKSKGGGAQFITRAEIEKRDPHVTADLLRRYAGFKIVDSGGVAVAVSTRGPKPRLINRDNPIAACVLRIGVDGFVRDAGFAMNSITPRDIYGIEV
jgi:hypothetical protein